jgi:hypothetical protein
MDNQHLESTSSFAISPSKGGQQQQQSSSTTGTASLNLIQNTQQQQNSNHWQQQHSEERKRKTKNELGIELHDNKRIPSYVIFLQLLFNELLVCEDNEKEYSQHKNKYSRGASQMLLEFITLYPSEQSFLPLLYTLFVHPRSLAKKNISESFYSSLLPDSSVNISSNKHRRTTNHQQMSFSSASAFLYDHEEYYSHIQQKQHIDELFKYMEDNYQSSFFPTINTAVSFILRLISCITTTRSRHFAQQPQCRISVSFDAIRIVILRYDNSALYDGSVVSHDKISSRTRNITANHQESQEDNNIVHDEEAEFSSKFSASLLQEATRYTGSSALDLACRYSDNPSLIVAMIEASALTASRNHNRNRNILLTKQSASMSSEGCSTPLPVAMTRPVTSLLHDLLLNTQKYHHDSSTCEEEDHDDGSNMVAINKIISSISNSLIYRKDTNICSRVLLLNYHQDKDEEEEKIIGKIDGKQQSRPASGAAVTTMVSQQETSIMNNDNDKNMILWNLLEKAATSGHIDTLKALLTINPHLIFQRNAETMYMILQATVLNFRYESSQKLLSHYLPKHEWSGRIEFLLHEGIKYQIKYNLSSYLVGGLFAVESHIDGVLEEIMHLLGRETCWHMITCCLNQYSYEDVPILHAAIGKAHPETIKGITEQFRDSASLRDRSGDLAIHVAIKRGMKWTHGLSDILAANPVLDANEIAVASSAVESAPGGEGVT